MFIIGVAPIDMSRMRNQCQTNVVCGLGFETIKAAKMIQN